MMYRKVCLSIIIVITSVNAESRACNPRDNKFNYEGCLANTLKVEKLALNQLYAKIYVMTNAKPQFEATQKAWLVYRAKQCGDFIDTDSDHSPASGVMGLNCEVELTKQRIQYLTDIEN